MRKGALNKPGLRSELVRQTNLSTILNLVHTSGPLTRSQIVSITGLSRNSVGDLVSELAAEKLVSEYISPSSGTRGRPSSTVHPKPQTSVVLAADILVDSLAVAAIGLGGDIVEHTCVQRDRTHNSPNLVARDLAKIIRSVAQKISPRATIYGIGVAVPGLIDSKTQIVLLAPNLGWANVSFVSLLEHELSTPLPISIGNDGDFGALAESKRGIATGIDNMLYLAADVGIGGGVIADGALLSGTRGFSGEVGHIPIDLDGQLCSCGAFGCWETVICTEAFVTQIGVKGTPTHKVLADSLIAAENGDEQALAAYGTHGYWLGIGLAGILNTLNPQMVTLGGFLGPAYPYLSEQLSDELRRRVMPAIFETCVIAPSSLGAKAQIQGAGEFAWNSAISDIFEAKSSSTTVKSLVGGKG